MDMPAIKTTNKTEIGTRTAVPAATPRDFPRQVHANLVSIHAVDAAVVVLRRRAWRWWWSPE